MAIHKTIYSFDENVEPHEATHEEILELYDLEGLSLNELQEKYVIMYDEFEENIKNLEDQNEELKSDYNNLLETYQELNTTIENQNEIMQYKLEQNESNTTGWFIICIIVAIVFFYLGKSFSMKGD